MRSTNSHIRWLRFAALTAALAALFFLASGATLWHFDTRGSEATCPICHVAHMSALQTMPMDLPAAFVPIGWVLPAETQLGHAELFSLIPPSRAPPA